MKIDFYTTSSRQSYIYIISVLDVQCFFYLFKKIGFAPWPNIMLIIYYWQEIFLLNLTSDSEAIFWWYHRIVCGLNQAIERVVNLNMTLLIFFVCLFLFDFVHLHARCGCCSIVYWHFHVRQAKQVDCKMSTEKTFCDIFGQLQTRKSR